MKVWIALVLALSIIPGEITGPQPGLPKSPLVIETARGPARFTIELAETPTQQQRGLMFRTALAPDAGMLFAYGDERPRSFWMKNTPLPLDILFVKANGTIVRIAANAKPPRKTPFLPMNPSVRCLRLQADAQPNWVWRWATRCDIPSFRTSEPAGWGVCGNWTCRVLLNLNVFRPT
jgi:uncharacterized protein